MSGQATLYTFGPSHFCEKARWALDLGGVAYREVRWAPGAHAFAARRLGAGSSVPILTCADGVIQGSGAIIDWLEAAGRIAWRCDGSSAERAEIGLFETRADDVIGPATRRLIYAAGLSVEPRPIARQLFAGVAPAQRRLAWLLWPLTRQIMAFGMNARPGDRDAARADVDRELDALDARLDDGRRFLVGDRLTRADIAVASLLAPLARPPQHPVYRDLAPWRTYQQIIDRYRQRPAVHWVRRLYADHRPPCIDRSRANRDSPY